MKYMDANILIYWLGDDPLYGEKATEIIRRVENGERVATSTLNIWFTHIVLKRLGSGYSEEKMLNKIEALKYLRIVQLTIKDVKEAVKLMKKYHLDLEDAIQRATALRVGAKQIYSNDEDFDRTPLKRIF